MPGTLPLGNTLSVFVFNWTKLTPSLNHLFLWRGSPAFAYPVAARSFGLERQAGHLVLHSG